MSTPSIYNLWLQLQCQMVAECLEGVLVKHVAGERSRVLAHWPETRAISREASEAAKACSHTRKLQLTRDKKSGVFLAHPIVMEGDYWGTIVLHLASGKPQVVQAVIKLLKWGFTWLHAVSQLLAGTRKNDDGLDQSKQILDLLSRALKEQTLEETAITTVNHIARSFGFARVSLGLIKHGKPALQAISFNAQFDSNTDIAREIQAVMTESLSQNSDVSFPSSPDNAAINRYHKALVQQHKLKAAHSLILRSRSQPAAILTLEDANRSRLDDSTRAAISQSAEAIAELLNLKNRPQTEALGPGDTWRERFTHRWLKLRTLEALLGGFLAIITAVSFIPAPYEIKTRAILQSTSSHVVPAPFDGYLGEILVKPGDQVEAGALLASLKSDDLKLEQRRLGSQLQQYRLEYDNALAEGNRAQAAIMSAQVDQAQVQLDLLQQQLGRTELRAPVNGTVISDDIRQSAGAPTARGDVLFLIADIEHYDVQLLVSESAIGDVQQGQTGELMLNSLPGQQFDLTVTRITPISEARDGNNYFKVEARLGKTDKLLRPGMTGDGKIAVERRRLGWIWFHEVWHWLRRVLWL